MKGISTIQWRKSSRSGGDGGACVEVAGLDPAIAIRDSKNPGGPVLTLTVASWRTFTHRIKACHHDLT